MVTGLVVDGTGFEVLAGDERIGSRRPISPADVELLTGLAGRYVRAQQANDDASAPRGQHELDFEAEGAAILAAVGESRIDLVVEDTGDRSSWPGWQPWAGCRWCTCPATG